MKQGRNIVYLLPVYCWHNACFQVNTCGTNAQSNQIGDPWLLYPGPNARNSGVPPCQRDFAAVVTFGTRGFGR